MIGLYQIIAYEEAAGCLEADAVHIYSPATAVAVGNSRCCDYVAEPSEPESEPVSVEALEPALSEPASSESAL